MANDPGHMGPIPSSLHPGGPRTQSQETDASRSLLWVGRVLHVDVETMVCSVQLETGTGVRFDVPLTAPGGGGPRSWSGTIPEQGSKCVIQWRRYGAGTFAPYIVEWMTVGTYSAREFEPFSVVDPADAEEVRRVAPELFDDPHLGLGITRLKLRKAYSGDYLSQAGEGGEILLDRNAHLANRAGNEFELRDSDQTAVLQSVNELSNNAAGTYRRGLIRRNAYNLLPDLAISGFNPSTDNFDRFTAGKLTTSADGVTTVVTKVEPGSEAWEKLLEFGLINPDGTPVDAVGSDPEDPVYPFVVLPDGQRSSYVVLGEHDQSFADTDQCYVEDRADLRHTSDGIMAVTEDGDGVQIDQVPPVFIEDVKGTVVGNDPYTEAGRSLYKRVLKMHVFDDPDQQSNASSPSLQPVDTTTSQTEADTQGLARLFRIQSPTTSNQYVFGVSKEGRVYLHIPKTKTGTAQDRGKSLDANILGLVKAVIGADENTGRSVDLRTMGGIRAEIGTFQDFSNPAGPEQVSIDLVLHGKIRTTYAGTQGRETMVGGSDFRSASGSTLDVIGGNVVRNVGGSEAVEASSITHNVGFGGYKLKSAGDVNQTVLGKTTEMYGQFRQSTFALSDTKTMLVGVDSQTVLAGGITRTVAAGAGISDTVGAGNILSNVATGNMGFTVGAGNMTATVGAGNLALSAGAGTATMTGGVAATVSSGTVVNLAAPVTKIGLSVVGNVVAGVPGPPSVALDYITGLPLLGQPTVFIGP
jgi:hypothetical protein